MFDLAIWLVSIFLAMAAFQSLFAIGFAIRLSRVRGYHDGGERLPFVSILMPLRGADPCLAETLKGLLSLDYPAFDLRIIVDSRQDPAWAVVEQTIQEIGAKNVVLDSIRDRRTTCGLQCSALSQAARDLPPKTEIVVTVDGDIRAHSTLLRSLVKPFSDPQVGLTFGNRWFTPPDLRWGAWVRYLWNTAAVVPMYLFGIPWGGCFAIRRSALEDCGLAEAWGKVMVHDAPAKSLLTKIGLRVQFVPELMISNSDTCNLAFSHDFIKRQMLWTRLYHPNFAPVLLHAIVTSMMTIVLIGIALLGFVLADWKTGIVAIGGLAAYLVWLTGLVAMLDRAVNHVFRVRNAVVPRYSWLAWFRMPVAILVTQAVYLSSILLATLRNQVLWRGIRYSIHSAYQVERLNDQVFRQEMDSNGVSL